MNVLLSAITPSTTNPRKRFDQAKLDELTDSIKRLGVLQPILLRP
jgi:ParB-like chromosome segregation protein Spo0J